MMGYNWYGMNMYDWGNFSSILPFLAPFAILDIVLKGFALWKAARRGETYWFIAILIINSLGILPAIYLLLTRDEKIVKTSK